MRIGILGSGLMGGKLGTIFARAGHDVVFSYAGTEQKLNRLAREANGNARAGTPAQAAQNADAILLAVHWSRMDDVLNQAGDLSGKVIVSCSLPMNRGDTNSSSRTLRLARRSLQNGFQKRGSCPLSTPFRAKCFSRCTKAGAGLVGLVWCTAAMIDAVRSWRPT